MSVCSLIMSQNQLQSHEKVSALLLFFMQNAHFRQSEKLLKFDAKSTIFFSINGINEESFPLSFGPVRFSKEKFETKTKGSFLIS